MTFSCRISPRSLLQAAGVALPTLPALSSVIFVVGCGVTATGQ